MFFYKFASLSRFLLSDIIFSTEEKTLSLATDVAGIMQCVQYVQYVRAIFLSKLYDEFFHHCNTQSLKSIHSSFSYKCNSSYNYKIIIYYKIDTYRYI